MPELHIEFEWWRCSNGYRLVAEKPPIRLPQIKWGESTTIYAGQHFKDYSISPNGDIILNVKLPETLLNNSSRNLQERIVCQRGARISYRPLETFPTLFRQFATAEPTSRGILDFINSFGPLTRDGLDEKRGENVSALIEQVKAMRQVINVYPREDKPDLPRLLGTNGIELSSIKTSLISDPVTRMPRLQLSVVDLLTALWLQLGQALSSGATIRRCEHCGLLFEAGPGTGRRLDAKFCRDEHRVAFNSLKRSQGR